MADARAFFLKDICCCAEKMVREFVWETVKNDGELWKVEKSYRDICQKEWQCVGIYCAKNKNKTIFFEKCVAESVKYV